MGCCRRGAPGPEGPAATFESVEFTSTAAPTTGEGEDPFIGTLDFEWTGSTGSITGVVIGAPATEIDIPAGTFLVSWAIEGTVNFTNSPAWATGTSVYSDESRPGFGLSGDDFFSLFLSAPVRRIEGPATVTLTLNIESGSIDNVATVTIVKIG